MFAIITICSLESWNQHSFSADRYLQRAFCRSAEIAADFFWTFEEEQKKVQTFCTKNFIWGFLRMPEKILRKTEYYERFSSWMWLDWLGWLGCLGLAVLKALRWLQSWHFFSYHGASAAAVCVCVCVCVINSLSYLNEKKWKKTWKKKKKRKYRTKNA